MLPNRSVGRNCAFIQCSACEKDGFKAGDVGSKATVGRQLHPCTWEQTRDKSGSSRRNEILSVNLDNLLSVKDRLEISRPLENIQA